MNLNVILFLKDSHELGQLNVTDIPKARLHLSPEAPARKGTSGPSDF